MKKTLKTMLLLWALIVGGVCSVWAADDYSFTFQTKQFSANGTVTLNDVSWTLSGNGGYWGYDGTKGQQFGSGTKPYKSLSLTTSDIGGTITSIVVNASTASSASATISCTVGGSAFGTQSQSMSTSATNYTFSGSALGEIVISMSQTTSKALYLKSISVTYTTGGGDTPTTYTVIYDANGATSGDVPTDDTEYEDGDEVTVLGNTGDLAKTGCEFVGWNTQANGEGTNYDADETFEISANTTLYAKWNPYTITAVSNNESYGSVSLDGSVITAVPADGYTYAAPAYSVSPEKSATVVQDGNTFTVTPTANTEVTINFELLPTHTATFSVNGETSTQEYAENATITFPSNPSDVNGKTFVGWTATAIDGTTDEAPTFVTSATMGQSDVKYYAVFAYANESGSSVVDQLTPSFIGVSTYSDWSGRTGESGAVYAGNSTGGDDVIQMRSNNSNSGIVTTKSGGIVKKVAIEWNSTGNARTLSIYGKNTAYKAATELYDDNKKGTLLGGIKTSDSNLELTITGDYEYIGFRSESGAMYLNKINITWSPRGGVSYSDYCTTVVADSKQDAELSFSATEVNANISEQFTAPTLNTAEGFNCTVEYTSSDESVAQVMDSETGDLMLLKEGTTTITATFAGNDDYKTGSASYTLNVTDDRIATTITQENIVLDVSEVASFTQLNPVVKDAENNVIDYEFSEFLSIVSFEQVSEDDVISSIDCNTGVITLSGNVGTATLKAYYNRFNNNSTYKPSECSFTITVESVQTILAARAQGTGEVLTKGVVTSCSGTTAYIQDATAAICVYGEALTVGDEVKVRGTLKDYNGLLEITSPTATVLSHGNTVTPEVMTIDEINASEKQGWLVKIEDATVTAISGQNTTITQGENTIVVRGITGIEYEVDDVLTLTGNIGCYNVAQIANPTDVTVKQPAPVPSIAINPASINATTAETVGTQDLTYENLVITGMDDFDVQYYDSEGEETEAPDWIEVLVAEQDPSIGEGYVVSYVIGANEGKSRTTFFKVYAMDNETNIIYSNLVTITQDAYVAPVVTEIALDENSGSTVYGTPKTVEYLVTEEYDGELGYAIDNDAIASVKIDASTITFTPKAVGTAIITISAPATSGFNAAEDVTYTLTVTAPEGQTEAAIASITLFNETFDKCEGTGGRDEEFTGSVGTASTTGKLDESWATISNNGAYQCIKLGTGKAAGSVTTSNISLSDSGILTFSAAGWGDDNTNTVQVTASGATLTGDTNVTLEKGTWKNYSVNITEATTGTVAITFTMKRGFLDDVVVKTAGADLSIKLNDYGYATFCSEYPLDFNNAIDYSAWQVKGIDDSKVLFEQIEGSVKGGTGIFLKGEPNATITLTSEYSENFMIDNMLTGTTAPTYVTTVDGDYTNFGLSGEKFVKINDGVVKAGKAYLPVPTSIVESLAGARLTFVFEDETTGIRSIENGEWGIDNYFDLQGRKIAKPAKGLYIKNGKKVVVK